MSFLKTDHHHELHAPPRSSRSAEAHRRESEGNHHHISPDSRSSHAILKQRSSGVEHPPTQHGDEEGEEGKEEGEEGEDKPKKKERKIKQTLTERIKEFCTRADVFATGHILPVHVICIIVATVIVPISAVSIVWDLMSAVVFQIPDLSTINLPAFVLFINFVAMPLAMYGYMMEFLMHEHSQLAQVGLICVVVNPILFLVRALIEVIFDGFRGEEKVYFEGFNREGPGAKYPLDIVRYKQGVPFSDSDTGKRLISNIFDPDDIVDNRELELDQF